MSRVIAFDFDNTLTVEEWGKPTGWNERMLRRMRLHAFEGDVIIIVTARHGQEADERLSSLGWEQVGSYPLVYASVARHRLPVGAVFFTDGALKGPFLVELGAEVLYDDNPEQRLSAVEHGIEAIVPLYP